MEKDASLDDFLDAADDQEVEPDESDEGAGRGGASSDAETQDASEGVSDDAAEDTDADVSGGAEETAIRDPSAVEPAGATYDWTPGGAACEACDEVVERRWRDGPGFVCENCKDW